MISHAQVFKRVQPALGTLIELSVEHDSFEKAQALMTSAFAEARRLESVLSAFTPWSELSRLNSAPLETVVSVSAELEFVLHLGRKIEKLSHRSFRLMPECTHETESCYSLNGNKVLKATNCRFDLGGIAKGYIVDRLFEELKTQLEDRPFSVNAGGDLRCQGDHSVEIRVPTLGDEKRYELAIQNCAVASSSLRGLQVGQPAARYAGRSGEAVAVTVMGALCAAADALTKAVLFGGWNEALSTAYPTAQIFAFDRFGNLHDSQ